MATDAAVMQPAGNRTHPLYVVRVRQGGETLARQTGLLTPASAPCEDSPTSSLLRLSETFLLSGGELSSRVGASANPEGRRPSKLSHPPERRRWRWWESGPRIGVTSKAREVRMAHRVMVRDGEAISELLTLMGAPGAVSEWEKLRERREVRATANRLVNFDDANLRRSAQAAVAACARVERALEILGEEIPDHLLYAGNLRLTHRDASLDELGHHADPPLTKDAVAGRIRRLLAMADKKAEDLGIPSTLDAVPAEVD